MILLSKMVITRYLSVMIAVIGLIALIELAPIDLKIASWFYSDLCRCFPVGELSWVREIDRVIAWSGRVALPLILAAMLYFWLRLLAGGQAVASYRRGLRALGFMAILGAVTPLILIHEVLKPEVGRARPREVREFSGPQMFTPAWIKSEACRRNCSFTSGHVAFGAWLTTAWYVAGRFRWIWLFLGTGMTLLIGWSRMAQGAHFFSDVVGSILLVWLTAQLLVMAKTFDLRHGH
ncbi:MAG: phosphatase PAP2 family protein [Betaproteobacteria bacterium]|nr:phosphatase PAP2 family protein [Betaproteobacteria bacterium]